MNSKFYRNYSTKKESDISTTRHKELTCLEGVEITEDKETSPSAKTSNLKNSSYPRDRKRANSNNPLILTEYLKEALIGLTLGDLSLEKATNNSNVRLRFDQGIIHSNYLYFLYDKFKDYTLTPPKSTNRKPDKRTGGTLCIKYIIA